MTYGLGVSNIQVVVEATPERDCPVLVAVDGVDGSGKTTFADLLAEGFREKGRAAVVVHLDDFLNDRVTRYRLGRTSPDGYFKDTYNLDAFRANVLEPLRLGGEHAIVPRAFDYLTDTNVDDEPLTVPLGCVVIVEEMFMHRDELRDVWDLSVLLEVPFEISVRRMADRDGGDPDPESASQHRYVQGQRLYLAYVAADQGYLRDQQRLTSIFHAAAG